MKNILVVGATGQIGSELTMTLRRQYGFDNVVAGYIASAPPVGELLESGPSAVTDVTDAEALDKVIKKHGIDTVYNLAALLSATAEKYPQMAWHIQIDGLMNILEIAKERNCAVFTPSSIGAFGPDTPKDSTPQDTVQHPQTIYGVTKVTSELLSNYYHTRYGVDTRSVRFPGILSHVTLPGGGTTDYAVEIFYAAARGECFECPIAAGTFMDMMYMPDALDAAIRIMEADPSRLVHRNSFNVAAMSFDPEILSNEIRKYVPEFRMNYRIDPLRQAIADSWPNSLDDSCARAEWGWEPQYDLPKTTEDMLTRIGEKITKTENITPSGVKLELCQN